jgi:MFS family permease
LALELAAFGVFGLAVGCYAVLLADLSRALGLSPGPLGVALLFGAASSVAGMASLGWIFDAPGGRSYLAPVFCGWGIGIAGLALAGSYPVFVAAQALFSFSGGLCDVGINALAVDLERLSRRRLMSYLHAAYSGGAVAGSLMPERAGTAVSVVTTLGYGTFLLGPPLVGGLAEVVGLRIALGIIALAGLAAFFFSYELRDDREKRVPHESPPNVR